MPLPILRSPRCLLRPWTESDIDELHRVWTEPAVRQYLWDDVVIPREEAASAVASMMSAEGDGLGGWSVYLQDDPLTIAGFAGFRYIENTENIELMYGLREQYHGRGIATEISSVLLDHLWKSTRFERVLARTDPPNLKSVAVMERLGMTHESTTDAAVTYSMCRPVAS